MDDRTLKGDARSSTVRDRRYSIRFPFAADVVLLDMESGNKAEGVTSDISMGGAFICTSRPFASNARVRITLTRKDQRVEALAVVRIVKPRIGLGVEFMDVEAPFHDVLYRWVEQLRKSR
jgi:PilZ domain